MRSPIIKTAFVFVLIFCLSTSQIMSVLAHTYDDTLQVGFLGIEFENLPEDIQNILSWRISEVLDIQGAFLLSRPDALLKGHSVEINQILAEGKIELLSKFAAQNGFDHLFYGKLRNQSPDRDSIELVGRLNRFDAATQQIQSYEMSCNYDRFGAELLEFRDQYVLDLRTVVLPLATKEKKSQSATWTKLFIGGAIIAGVFAIRSLAGPAKGGEETIGLPTSTDE